MMLPSTLKSINEWLFVGPIGPEVPNFLEKLPTVAVDGGANYAREPEIWVGDADSYDFVVSAAHSFKHSTQKDFSDLALAFELLRDQRHYKLHLWGFLGERKDHELFNLGEAFRFLDAHTESEVLFYNKVGKVEFHLLGAGQWRFTHFGLFSLGSLKKPTVKLTGACEFQINKPYALSPLSSFGLSNVANGQLYLENSGPVFIYYPEGK